MLQKASADVYVGTLNQFNLLTPFIKLNMYVDVWGAKYTFANAVAKFNTVDWSFCTFADWTVEVAKVLIYTEVDVNECMFGTASYFDTVEEAWQC